MFLIISWIIAGAVFGSVGVAFIASAMAGHGRRGDPNLDAMFLLLFVTTVVGAVGGGLLARTVRRDLSDNVRKQQQFGLLALLAAATLIGYALFKG